MKRIYIASIIAYLLSLSQGPSAQEVKYKWDSPKVVTPGKMKRDCMAPAPSDAIMLFDGTGLSLFENAKNGGPAKWTIENGMVTIPAEGGDIQTKQSFRDFQLHIEWRIPEDIQGEGQFCGNSGIFLQGKYEIQVLNSYNNETYYVGQAGSVYNQKPPLVNATNKPGEWNVYDIVFTAPTFKKDGTYRTYPSVTIFHNGIIVQNNTTIVGLTFKDYQGFSSGDGRDTGPILLQDHQSPVSYRNIWIREL